MAAASATPNREKKRQRQKQERYNAGLCIDWREKKKIIDDLKSRRLKMAVYRRSEIQMAAYNGLPIIRSPEG